MRSDIEIAQSTTLLPIDRVARKLGLGEEDLERNGQYMAKLRLPREKRKQRGKLILVTAINPTQAGEGKTTTSIGLADAMNRLGAKTVLALREPSLGPVFGLKGGATGGGMAQIVPMEEINLHFTGDFHAIGAANNLLAAMVDNHIYQGNELGIDRVVWRRCVDMNDRQLRSVLSGVGGGTNGVPRAEHFDITVASEVMAVFCLAEDLSDLKTRLGRMIVGYTREGKPVTAHDLKAEGAMTALLKDALKPNLVQTLEGTPAFVHGGPFANIAHGCNSVTATRMALRLGDYAVTEAGFGADLGAEKFLDIKCRLAGLKPSAVVVVATVRALKHHGGAAKAELNTENLDALEKGLRLKDFAEVLYHMIMDEFDAVVDKCQVTLVTDRAQVEKILNEEAMPRYNKRDDRLASMTDEAVDRFYTCILCQSFAPAHCCVVTPERLGLCGAVSWLDAKATHELNPNGPCQPIMKEGCLDERTGRYETVNKMVNEATHGAVDSVTLYSILEDPMTSCGCFECICGIEPMSNGFIVVNREFKGMTPAGMTFGELASCTGGGVQTPGYMGHGRHFISSKKFIHAEGGIKRIVWMPKELKDDVAEKLNKTAMELYGIENFADYIADETICTDCEELLNFLTEKGHPVLEMEPLM